MIVISGQLDWRSYARSEHPEYFAIHSTISAHPEHRYILVGNGPKYENFRAGNVTFLNLSSSGKFRKLLSMFIVFLLAVILKPSVIVCLGNHIPVGVASVLTQAKLISVVVGEVKYSVLSKPRSLRKIYFFLLKAAFQRSYAILAINKSIRRDIHRSCGIDFRKIFTYKLKVSEIFNPNVPKDLKLSLNPKGPIVLSVSRISPEKGLEYLVRASRIVIEKIPNVKFVIKAYHSEKGYEQHLLRLINYHNLSSHFIISRRSPYSEMPSYMAAADVFVLPSLSEGLPVAMLESFACGVPVVASRVGGIPEVLTHGYNGFLVEPMDVKGLAEAIMEVLLVKETMEKLSIGAIATAGRMRRNELGSLLRKLLFGR